MSDGTLNVTIQWYVPPITSHLQTKGNVPFTPWEDIVINPTWQKKVTQHTKMYHTWSTSPFWRGILCRPERCDNWCRMAIIIMKYRYDCQRGLILQENTLNDLHTFLRSDMALYARHSRNHLKRVVVRQKIVFPQQNESLDTAVERKLAVLSSSVGDGGRVLHYCWTMEVGLSLRLSLGVKWQRTIFDFRTHVLSRSYCV